MKVSIVDDVLSSNEQEIYPTTSRVENSIEFEFRTDCNVYVDLRKTYLALKIKLVEKDVVLILTKQQKRKRSTKKTLFLLKQVTMTLNL